MKGLIYGMSAKRLFAGFFVWGWLTVAILALLMSRPLSVQGQDGQGGSLPELIPEPGVDIRVRIPKLQDEEDAIMRGNRDFLQNIIADVLTVYDWTDEGINARPPSEVGLHVEIPTLSGRGNEIDQTETTLRTLERIQAKQDAKMPQFLEGAGSDAVDIGGVDRFIYEPTAPETGSLPLASPIGVDPDWWEDISKRYEENGRPLIEQYKKNDLDSRKVTLGGLLETETSIYWKELYDGLQGYWDDLMSHPPEKSVSTEAAEKNKRSRGVPFGRGKMRSYLSTLFRDVFSRDDSAELSPKVSE